MGLFRGLTLSLFAVSLAIAPAGQARAAGKIDLMAGYFGINAKQDTSSSSLSGAGAYMLAYRLPFWTNFDLQISYSIDATKTIGGDLAFGPDLGVLLFPLGTSAPTVATGDAVTMEINEMIKPYVGGAFSQRQYQSTQSTFAGFGGMLGCDVNYWKSVALRADIRYILFAGPDDATASELDIMLGMTFRLGK